MLLIDSFTWKIRCGVLYVVQFNLLKEMELAPVTKKNRPLVNLWLILDLKAYLQLNRMIPLLLIWTALAFCGRMTRIVSIRLQRQLVVEISVWLRNIPCGRRLTPKPRNRCMLCLVPVELVIYHILEYYVVVSFLRIVSVTF